MTDGEALDLKTTLDFYLAEMLRNLKPGMRATVIFTGTDGADRDVLVSNDDPVRVVKVVERFHPGTLAKAVQT